MVAVCALVLAFGMLQQSSTAGPQTVPPQQSLQPSQPATGRSEAQSAPSAAVTDQRSLERIRKQLEQPQVLTVAGRTADTPVFRVDVYGRSFSLPSWQETFVIPPAPALPPGGSDAMTIERLNTPQWFRDGMAYYNRDAARLATVMAETWLAGLAVKKITEARKNGAINRARQEVQQELAEVAAHNARVAAGQADDGAAADKKQAEAKKKKKAP